MPTLRLHTPGFNDEKLEIYVDKQLIATADHDRHGWDGMDLARELVTRLGAELGLPVVQSEGVLDE